MSDPYSVPPGHFVNFAQQMQASPMAGRMPVSSFGMTPGQSPLGPSHAALQQKLGVAMQQSNALPSLMQQLVGNPALAHHMGGMGGENYTPAGADAPWRLNMYGPDDTHAGGPTPMAKPTPPAGTPSGATGWHTPYAGMPARSLLEQLLASAAGN